MTRLAVLVLLLALAGSAQAAPKQNHCDFGQPISESVLLQPQPGSFYSRDALAPDIVKFHGGYRLYFSGNDSEGLGHWQTGVATSDSPTGPFTVQPYVFPFEDGETINYKGGLLTSAERTDHFFSPRLWWSKDGTAFAQTGRLPAEHGPSWHLLRADSSLVKSPGGFTVYSTAKPGHVGADLASQRFLNGHWQQPKLILRRGQGWDSADLGSPSVFHARGRDYLLYGGMPSLSDSPRSIGLAYRSQSRWVRCGIFIPPGPGYETEAVDPTALVENGKLYVYFGGGRSVSSWGNMNGKILVRVYALS